MVATIAISMESWNRNAISDTIGWPVHIDLPKSKCSRPQRKCPNWTIIGWSMPRLWRQIVSADSSK